MDEHVILVAFEVAGNSRTDAQVALLTRLPRPDDGGVIAWWIAEDDRIDDTDNNSAVFVPKGEQQATTDRLARREPHARYVVLVGNPGAALTLYGPFEEHEDAVRFADDTFKDQSWSVDALMGTLA
jgi:hypothetical protein